MPVLHYRSITVERWLWRVLLMFVWGLRGNGALFVQEMLSDGAVSTDMSVEFGNDGAWYVLTGESCRHSASFVYVLVAEIMRLAAVRHYLCWP